MDLEIADIHAGDVLLCYSRLTAEEETASGTGYSHVAITLPGGRVLQADKGVEVVSVESLFEDYDHIAVLREATAQELWDDERLKALEEFAAKAIGKPFNRIGLQRFPARKESYASDLMERVEGYFEGTTAQVQSDRGLYFCSELITAAFIYVGIIDPSAAVVFTPETFSPSDIAKDKVFGFFRGYVRHSPGYVVPNNDYFKSNI